MLFKKQRYWMAGKILGGRIIEQVDVEAQKAAWIKEQLSHGNSVTLEYKITHIDEARNAR